MYLFDPFPILLDSSQHIPSHLHVIFLKNTELTGYPASNWCHLRVHLLHVHRIEPTTRAWATNKSHVPKEQSHYIPSHHQLPIAPHLGLGSPELLSHPCWVLTTSILCRTCAGCHICCEFTSAAARRQHFTSLFTFSGSNFVYTSFRPPAAGYSDMISLPIHSICTSDVSVGYHHLCSQRPEEW